MEGVSDHNQSGLPVMDDELQQESNLQKCFEQNLHNEASGAMEMEEPNETDLMQPIQNMQHMVSQYSISNSTYVF